MSPSKEFIALRPDQSAARIARAVYTLIGRTGGMWRRSFIASLAIVSMVPLPPQAQSADTMRRIGVLAQDLQPGLLETFRDELRKLGHVEGIGLSIELRNAGGDAEQLPLLARELLRFDPDVLVAINTPAAKAAKAATQSVPIVMMRVADPVKSGLVGSLAHPGGNLTGISFMPDELGPKGVEMLHEILPGITRMAALYQGRNAGAVVIIDEVVRKGAELGLSFVRLPVHDSRDYEAAFDAAVRAGAQALFAMDDGAITKQRAKILELAGKHTLPVVSIYRDFAEAGGLIAYGPRLEDVYRRAADYTDKLLKGKAPGDLPVERPTKFDLVVNLKTAKALGIEVSPSLLARADEVIE